MLFTQQQGTGMASTTNADGTTGNGTTGGGAGQGMEPGMELAGRLSEMGSRTSLMVIDAALRTAALAELEASGSAALSPFGEDAGFAGAAAEMQALARRMLQATQDFQAAICEPAD
ncbi:hypothetical protein Sp245p_02605 [Azospirillum baldaniorum]|uniref:Uncharacterized protein n=1 Tax=Azospirillum baldaniorum TaxID=1064539 RepID=A0A9P1JMV3_9PROT|nr:hypothetical protein [Azospirillum baldaniorum]TWA79709.1 hypothetical protein FBZ85_10446 [Azospirillum brasilense]AWJ88750.1 hypothetical protein Sp245p_02605 [Azospirillum baldaniorum]NUB06548.1 hypothetical protein [Azospirillum baldaniorum]TWA62306.1 hypothetical protein FBZ84_11181 [Azospirillum baldaniorum]CCC96263.1 protein of unknown function [Azospirillum baldaniorum]